MLDIVYMQRCLIRDSNCASSASPEVGYCPAASQARRWMSLSARAFGSAGSEAEVGPSLPCPADANRVSSTAAWHGVVGSQESSWSL
jgi:hypothetical protein